MQHHHTAHAAAELGWVGAEATMCFSSCWAARQCVNRKQAHPHVLSTATTCCHMPACLLLIPPQTHTCSSSSKSSCVKTRVLGSRLAVNLDSSSASVRRWSCLVTSWPATISVRLLLDFLAVLTNSNGSCDKAYVYSTFCLGVNGQQQVSNVPCGLHRAPVTSDTAASD